MKLTPHPCVLLLVFVVFLCFPSLAFPRLHICGLKVLLLLLKLMLDLGGMVTCCAKRGNVEELHFLLKVFVKRVAVLEHQISLRIFNTQLCAQGMETIRQLMHILIPLLPQHGPLDVFLLIDPHRVILFLDVILE